MLPFYPHAVIDVIRENLLDILRGERVRRPIPYMTKNERVKGYEWSGNHFEGNKKYM